MIFTTAQLFQLRDAIGPVVGCNLDPSLLFWQGIDVVEVIRALGPAIDHVHAKDAGADAHNVRVNGVVAPKAFQDVPNRIWTYRTVGYGHDEEFRREFISTLRVVGADDALSIGREVPLMDPQESPERAVALLRGAILTPPAGKLWFA